MAQPLIDYLTIRNQIRDALRISCRNLNNDKLICGVIVISRNKRILLVQGRRTGKWSIPKGHIEHNEDTKACAIRELKEETGIVVNEFTFKNDIAKLRVGIYYFLETQTELALNPSDSSEVINSGWFNLQEIADNNLELNADANYIYRCMQRCLN